MRGATHEKRPEGSETQGKAANQTQATAGSSMRDQLRGQPFEVQAKMLAPVQRHGEGASGTDAVHAAAQHGVAGSGGSLPHLGAIQRAFGGHDVSNVQAHVGGAASEATKSMGASAYATGNDIAFGGSPDLHTAAHEAAHVVQQRAGVSLSGGVGSVGDRYEQHADKVADAVVAGKSAEPILGGVTGGSGGQSVQQRAVQFDAKSEAIATETADGGHSLDRHGPEVSEADLAERLTTGMTAKIGDTSQKVYSPAPGLATKFKTYENYNATRQAATDAASAAIGVTKAGVRTEVDAWTAASTTLEEKVTALAKAKTDKAGIADAGKAFGAAKGAAAKAESDLRKKAGTFADAATPGASVSFNKGGAETTGWDFLTLKPGYKCVIAHGAAIGVGFRGEDQKTVLQGNADGDTIYNNVSAPFDVTSTQTAFSGTGAKKLADCDDATEAAAWRAGQHYPCDPAEPVGISG